MGLTLGPFLSGIVYSKLYFDGTFLFFSCILAIIGILIYCFLPNRLNNDRNINNILDLNDSTDE